MLANLCFFCLFFLCDIYSVLIWLVRFLWMMSHSCTVNGLPCFLKYCLYRKCIDILHYSVFYIHTFYVLRCSYSWLFSSQKTSFCHNDTHETMITAVKISLLARLLFLEGISLHLHLSPLLIFYLFLQRKKKR